MKIRKQILKKLKKAYDGGMLTPVYPFTWWVRGLPVRNKSGYYNVGCGRCSGYGNLGYPDDWDNLCDCELSGKGIGYTKKAYKKKMEMKKRFYFTDVSQLPFDAKIKPNFYGHKNLEYWVKNTFKSMAISNTTHIERFKLKQTVLVFTTIEL